MGDPLLPGEGSPPSLRSLSPEPLEGNLDVAEVAISLFAHQKTGVGEADPTHPKHSNHPVKEQSPEAEAEEEEEAVRGEARPPGEQEGKNRDKR